MSVNFFRLVYDNPVNELFYDFGCQFGNIGVPIYKSHKFFNVIAFLACFGQFCPKHFYTVFKFCLFLFVSGRQFTEALVGQASRNLFLK